MESQQVSISHQVNIQERVAKAVRNLDKFDITDCLDILRYLQRFDSQQLQKADFQELIEKLECRIKFLVLKL